MLVLLLLLPADSPSQCMRMATVAQQLLLVQFVSVASPVSTPRNAYSAFVSAIRLLTTRTNGRSALV